MEKNEACDDFEKSSSKTKLKSEFINNNIKDKEQVNFDDYQSNIIYMNNIPRNDNSQNNNDLNHNININNKFNLEENNNQINNDTENLIVKEKNLLNKNYNTFTDNNDKYISNINELNMFCDKSENKKNLILNENQNSNDNNTHNNSGKSTLDNYLDSIGYNSFQVFTILIVCYVFFVDGSEMIIINLILTSIQRDWKITTFERSILSSAVFFGFFFGSFFSGYLTNKYGRKKPILLGVSLIYSFTFMTPYTSGFFSLFTLRFFVGIGIGFVVPATTSLITEIIPTFYRSFVLNILWVFYPFGIIYVCFISMFYIKDKEFLDWRKIATINSYSGIPMVLLSLFLCESPRYLLLKKKYEDAFLILNKIGKSKKIYLTETQKQKIIYESQLLEEANKSKSDFDIKTFFEPRFLRISLLLSYLWFITSLISYGLLYILPKLFDSLSKHDKYNSLIHMIYSMLILTFCPFFRGIISEMKSFGRINSMILGFCGAGVACLFCILNQSYLSISSGLLKFFVNTSLGIVSVFTSEVYPTNIRGIALGFGNSITRLGGIMTPFICEVVESFIPKGPFWLFIFGSLTGIIACLGLPYETMGMVLDKIPDKDENRKLTNFDCDNKLEKVDKEIKLCGNEI